MAQVSSFAPLVPDHAKLLILGSMPGTTSLAATRYYAHPRNDFWPIIERHFGQTAPLDYASRIALLMQNGIALWDVLAHCEREGSLDQAIVGKSEHPNDIAALLTANPGIRSILFNGSAAWQSFHRHVAKRIHADVTLHRLPSTSPAHASRTREEKYALWHDALQTAMPTAER